jgi:hypothetical protein
VVGETGDILIPEEAWREYQYRPGEKVIILPGSRTSGGFSIAKKTFLEKAGLSDILVSTPDLAGFRIGEGKTITSRGRVLCWTSLRDNSRLALPLHTLGAYGVGPGNRLLVARGSYVGVAMILRGPIVEEAKKHPEIDIFKVKTNKN